MISRLFLIFWLLQAIAAAHQIAEMTMRIDSDGDRFTATLEADAAYMLPEFRGDDDGAAPDLAWLRTSGPDTWQRIREEAQAYLDECLTFSEPTTLSFPDFETDPPRFITEGIPEMPPFIDVTYTGEIRGPLEVTWREPLGVVLIAWTDAGTVPIVSGETAVVLTPDPPTFGRWIQLGFLHLISAGLGHVLFILGIFLLATDRRQLIRLSLLFTLAHSAALAMAVLGGVEVPGRPVEIAIAASLVWIGVESLRRRDQPAVRYALVGGFGLIHGLGFAEKLIPLISSDRPGALAGFNLGIELGQFAVLTTAFALFAWWPEQAFKKLRFAGSLAIAAVGLVWILGRIFDVSLIPGT